MGAEELQEQFDGKPLKDEEGNVIGKCISAEWDGVKLVVECKLDELSEL